jgi:hypothetical protein
MITVKREGTNVRIAVSPGILNYIFYFDYQTGSDVCAELMRERIEKRLNDSLRAIRQEAYLDGYKDGRGKKGKKDWFKSWF